VTNTDSRLRELLNKSIDDELGPKRAAPPFVTPMAGPSGHRYAVRLRAWSIPLLAAAIVAVLFGATALASRHTSERAPVQPATSAPATATPSRPAPSQSQVAPLPSVSNSSPPPSHASSSAGSAAHYSASPNSPGRGADSLDFNGYGPVGLGMTSSEIEILRAARAERVASERRLQRCDLAGRHAEADRAVPVEVQAVRPPAWAVG
jgi:hypothetical protein